MTSYDFLRPPRTSQDPRILVKSIKIYKIRESLGNPSPRRARRAPRRGGPPREGGELRGAELRGAELRRDGGAGDAAPELGDAGAHARRFLGFLENYEFDRFLL